MVVTRSQTKLTTTAPTTSAPTQSTSRQRGSNSIATHSSRSSTMLARKLEAEAKHTRLLAQLELAEMQSQMEMEMEKKKVELERRTAEADYQAQLALIESESRRGSRSGRSHVSVENWIADTAQYEKEPNLKEINDTLTLQEAVTAPTEQIFDKTINLQCHGVATSGAHKVNGCWLSDNFAVQKPTRSPLPNTCGGDGFAATSLHKEDDSVSQLVQALKSLSNQNCSKNIVTLPVFDGKSSVDWLVFKRSFINSQMCFTAAQNIARLSTALKGAARDAVCMLLVTAVDPDTIIRELQRLFGRPEQIILKEVAAIRALPKVGHDIKDLATFASRVRNCVEVVKLLNETDYLRSPELFRALIHKLHPLLLTRWVDYASIRSAEVPNFGRVELLSDFLSQEVDLHLTFGISGETPYVSRERAHAISETESGIISNKVNKSKSTKTEIKNICFVCKQTHDISSCDKFVSMSVDDRWNFLKENKVCYKCLKKGSHNFRFCTQNKNKCNFCNRKNHHTLLHNPNFLPIEPTYNNQAQNTTPPQSSATTGKAGENTTRELLTHTSATSGLNVGSSRRPLLKIAAVTVSGPAGSVDTFALLDDGSTSTFIDSDISSRIGATGPEGQICLDCVGGLYRETSVQYVDFHIKGQHTSQTFSVHRARSIKNLGIVCNQTVSTENLIQYPYLSELSNELCYNQALPMLVIGIDNWHLSVATATKKGTKSQPVAIKTALGWVLFGFTNSWSRPVEFTESMCHAFLTEVENPRFELEQLIKTQYKLDSIGITKHEPRSTDDQRALQILERTARRLPSGRFEVGLLWKKDNMSTPDSYQMALSRFRHLEKKMSKEPVFAERYRKNIHDNFDKNYAEECTGVEPTGVCWYLPHFGVVNPNKPEKLRVVHDAAAKSLGVSLNSMLLTGPDLLQNQLSILMRFRERKIALTADIKEMFPQIKIIEQDRDAQRFLWRDDRSGPIKTFRMSSMIFGACSSPSTAIYVMNLNATEFRDEFPDTVDIIRNNTYMDDFIYSIDSIQVAQHLAAEIVTIHKRGGFEMRGWTSNESAALSKLPIDLLSSVSTNKVQDVNLCKEPVTRTLGLIWQPIYDQLKFNSGLTSESSTPLSKRQALMQVMRIYDPLGILAPITVKGRILFQNLWRKGLDWDDNLGEEDRKVWHEWYDSLRMISEFRLPRWYNFNNSEVAKLELHVFCDASEQAYVAVAYWRFIDNLGQAQLSLIASKARVAPLKPTSIPRLELQAALIATRLASFICDSHHFKPSARFFWCDSTTVLGWLRSDGRNFKPFVANRIGEILESSNVSEWRWVPTDLNVADDATRTKCSSLSVESRWISGPEFLLHASSDWPSDPPGSGITIDPLAEVELKSSARSLGSSAARFKSISNSSSTNVLCNYNEVNELPVPVVADPTHFSSWLRLVRATARAHQFIAACITRIRGVSNNFVLLPHSPLATNSQRSLRPLNAQSLQIAEVHVLRHSQKNTFNKELECLLRGRPLPPKSRLVILSPAINKDGLMFLKGRIDAAENVQDKAKHPILLDGKDPAVRLLISHFHYKFAHANTETVINELRQQYWILSLRNTVRSIVYNCQRCKLLRGKPIQPVMGDLPEARLSHHKRPFTFVGVDYFGPLQVIVRRSREKRWVALFTCLTTRAIHLEVVHSLSADAAIMCLRRFIARRGTPSKIYSDNGTAFVGANRQLRTLYDQAVGDFASNEKIEWIFIPPSAPFMGGAWERLVKSVKTALRITLRERSPSEEIFTTLLAEAEALVNARPLTHVSPDPTDPEALTPTHFLLGSSSGRPIPAQLTDSDMSSRSGWRKALRLADHFWKRWVSEYLPTLAPRKVRGTSNNTIKIGDPVLVADGDLPRGTWPRGIIKATYPGRDGVIRVADVETVAGTLRRPIRKLILL